MNLQNCTTYTSMNLSRPISDNDSGCFHAVDDNFASSSNASSHGDNPAMLKGILLNVFMCIECP